MNIRTAMFAIFAILAISSPAFADLFANATITPRYVDTSVSNQTFVYRLDLLNESLVNRTIIYAPENYSIVSIQEVTLGLNNASCLNSGCTEREVNSSVIAVNFSSAVNNTVNSPIIVTFLANTSATGTTGNFTSYLNNSLFNNVTSESAINATQVTTQQMIFANVTMTKGTAALNGTDFWEFKFTLGLATAQSGLIQFKMSDWTDAAGRKIYINTSATDSYLSLRNDTNLSAPVKFNVTNSYGLGINKTSTDLTDFYLKMIIPASSPISSTWSATYNLLFRAYP